MSEFLFTSESVSEGHPYKVAEQNSETPRYSAAAIVLHWLTALLVVAGFTLGLSMVGLPFSRQKLQWYAWHKWIGITIWLISCGRLAWRWIW